MKSLHDVPGKMKGQKQTSLVITLSNFLITKYTEGGKKMCKQTKWNKNKNRLKCTQNQCHVTDICSQTAAFLLASCRADAERALVFSSWFFNVLFLFDPPFKVRITYPSVRRQSRGGRRGGNSWQQEKRGGGGREQQSSLVCCTASGS